MTIVQQEAVKQVKHMLTLAALAFAWLSPTGGTETLIQIATPLAVSIIGIVSVAAVMRADVRALKKFQEGETERWDAHIKMHIEMVSNLSELKQISKDLTQRLNRVDDRVEDLRTTGRRHTDHPEA